MIAERQTLNLGEDFIAEIEGNTLRGSLRHIRLYEGEQATHQRHANDQQRGSSQQRFGVGSVELELIDLARERRGGAHYRVIQLEIGCPAIRHRIDHTLDELWHE